jgi:hypothetical protein
VTPASVEVIQSADRRRGVATLTLAFAADPIMRWAWPDAYQYATYWPQIAEAYGGRAFDHGTAHVLENFAAVALWLPPGVESDEATFGELIADSCGDQILRDLHAVIEQMAQLHPAADHWFLPLTGVDPVAQGRGLGSALLRHGLAACDRDRLPAYLEATSPRNRPSTSVTDSGSPTLSKQDHHRRCGRCSDSPGLWVQGRRSDSARASVSRAGHARGRTQITPLGRYTGGHAGDRVTAHIGGYLRARSRAVVTRSDRRGRRSPWMPTTAVARRR